MRRIKSPQKNNKYKVKFLPFSSTVSVSSGTSILDAAIKVDLYLKTTCGGKGTCGDCVVRIISGMYQSKLSSALSDELVRQGYALACQTEGKSPFAEEGEQYQQPSQVAEP